MRIRSHAGLLAVLGLSVGGLTALALSVSAGAAGGQVCMGVVVQDGSTADAIGPSGQRRPGHERSRGDECGRGRPHPEQLRAGVRHQ